MNNKLGKYSVIISALILPITLVIATLAEIYYKGVNPENVDITQSLAYLKPLLYIGFGTYITLAIAAFTISIMGLRNDVDKSLARLGFWLAIGVIVLSLATAGLSAHRDNIIEDYEAKQVINEQ